MKMISIVSVVDVVGALANNSLSGNIFLVDNNKVSGSSGEGTEALQTAVEEGDELVWIVQPLECEAHASIEGIVIDNDFCVPEKKFYQGTDVCYWRGKVKKSSIKTAIPYSLKFKIGSRVEEMSTTTSPCLMMKQSA